MNSVEVGVENLAASVSIAVLLISYFYVYRKARLDDFRQDLFIIRNEIWDLAYQNDCLNEKAHREFRRSLNSLIRFAPGLNLMTVFALSRVSPPRDTYESLENLIEDVSDGAFRQGLRIARLRTVKRVMKYLFLQTFPGCIVGLPVFLVVSVKRRFDPSLQKRLMDRIMTRPIFTRAARNVIQADRFHLYTAVHKNWTFQFWERPTHTVSHGPRDA